MPINRFETSIFFHQHSTEDVDRNKFKDKDIIDAGGWIGDSVLIFSPLTSRKVYSFEPSQENYAMMQKTMLLNGIKNAVCENMALGAENGEISLGILGVTPMYLASIATTVDPQDHFHKVPLITLDDYVVKHKLDVGLIKTDLEGAELDFLKGAEQTIKKQKPTLLISIYHTPEDFFEIKPLIESWNLGYTFKVVKGIDHSVCIETLLIAEIRDTI